MEATTAGTVVPPGAGRVAEADFSVN